MKNQAVSKKIYNRKILTVENHDIIVAGRFINRLMAAKSSVKIESSDALLLTSTTVK
jgi:hypothetical protein